MVNVGPVELSFTILLLVLSLLLSLLVYLGMYPLRRVQLLFTGFVRFARLYPPVIAVLLLVLILDNVLLVYFRISYFSATLTVIMAVAAALLIAVLIMFLMQSTIKKQVSSLRTQLLAVMAARFDSVAQLTSGAKIGTITYGPPLHWLQTALDTYRTSFTPVLIRRDEVMEALNGMVVDAVLVTEHASPALDEQIALGQVRLLSWSTEAIEAVTRAFPTVTRQAVLPPNTYYGQLGPIRGYTPY